MYSQPRNWEYVASIVKSTIVYIATIITVIIILTVATGKIGESFTLKKITRCWERDCFYDPICIIYLAVFTWITVFLVYNLLMLLKMWTVKKTISENLSQIVNRDYILLRNITSIFGVVHSLQSGQYFNRNKQSW